MISEVDIKDWNGNKYIKIAESVDIMHVVPGNVVCANIELGLYKGIDPYNQAIVEFNSGIEKYSRYYCVDLFTKVL